MSESETYEIRIQGRLDQLGQGMAGRPVVHPGPGQAAAGQGPFKPGLAVLQGQARQGFDHVQVQADPFAQHVKAGIQGRPAVRKSSCCENL